MKHVEMRISGQIDQRRSTWFEGLTIKPGEDDETLLSGLVADQTAVFGLISKVRDLGLNLISVNVTESVEVTHDRK